MSTVQTYLDMGGYGAFVWPAFAITSAVLVALWIDSMRSLRANQKALGRLRDGPVPPASAEGTAPRARHEVAP